MEKLYYKLLVISLHYFAAFAQCNKTSRYITELRRNVRATFFTCSNTNISEIYIAIQNERGNSNPCYIFLKNSSIPTLNPTGYSWKYVKTLQIEETHTNEIIPGFFNQFDDLEELHIIKNKITNLISGEFTSLVKLRVLNLTENLIETVAPKSFSGLLNLAILDLSKNKITHLPENIFQYQNHLFFVDVSNNMLENVDGAVFNKQSLKTLNISHNYLSDFDFNQLKNLTELEYLRLDHNVLSSLPVHGFYNLNNLNHLDLSFNQIKQIPFGLFNDLSKLTDLDLSSNHMVLDFHTLSTLKSLKVLKFTNNTVENFDVDTLSNRFKYLKFITLSNDQSWNCNELATAIHKLHFNNITVIRDQSTNGSNIFGISCDNSADLIYQRNTSPFPYHEPEEKINNENFTNTIFLKFVQNWNRYAANASNSLTNIETYMKKIINNDNRNLKENVPRQNISSSLNDVSSNNQTLISLTNSFNKISNNLPLEKKFEALISGNLDENKSNNNSGLILNNILLAMILCCLLISFAYRIYLKARIINNNNAQEQVQLM